MGATPVYSEFDTTPANAAADIKTKILTQTDWASLTGTGLTSAVKATTTRGAQMVVDFADAVATAGRLQLGVYRTHDGTTAVDKLVRYLPARTSGGATTDPWHVCVSASKEHLWVTVEGPRNGEPNAGLSLRTQFFLGDLLPYFAGDTNPVVVLAGCVSATAFGASSQAQVSRNAANTASWVAAYLATLQFPLVTNTSPGTGPAALTQQAAGDGNFYLWPWVVVETAAGLRGRLGYTFCAGNSLSSTGFADPVVSPGQKFTYAGGTYIATAGINGSSSQCPFGAGTTNGFAVVAVPSP